MSGRQRRIVIKLGGSTLTTPQYALRHKRLRILVGEIAQLALQGYTPILVSSGAVPTGYGVLRWPRYPLTIPEKQAAASVGQVALMHLYQQLFARYHLHVAQILLTQDDFSVRPRFVNIRNTIEMLLQNRVVPIVNENDTVTVDGIKVGDNDTLGALVATAVDAERYIILSDIDGLYTANPRLHKDATFIPTVESITSEIEALCGAKGSVGATGGMRTKIKAARIATAAGIEVVIGNGERPNILLELAQGTGVGTRFLAQKERLPGKKSWIAFSSRVEGRILIDAGAVQAVVQDNRSLLATGVTAIEGQFSVGSVVEICGPDGQELGRGISNYTSSDLYLLKGKNSQEILSLVPTLLNASIEVVHRNDLALYSSTIALR
ncbi:glutamate 5-kinase [Tengunoibacter tsumagoiensis]|uniref:Glutamate 5-kinase n=1 Tax=Tengunoibacter tsumagoiensis TaxID=2014871 RepID=A0A402AAJ0_9CHLR|nr:glutamate 5-kinase [Tengunoibacter tsumagoiensis]GCE16177.1 glutamate 5-kinase [Tengunoibacter tsumagoiensis]